MFIIIARLFLSIGQVKLKGQIITVNLKILDIVEEIQRLKD